MIIVAKSAIEQLNILKSIPEKEKLTTIVLANPWVSTDYHCNKVIYDKNMQQIMNFVHGQSAKQDKRISCACCKKNL